MRRRFVAAAIHRDPGLLLCRILLELENGTVRLTIHCINCLRSAVLDQNPQRLANHELYVLQRDADAGFGGRWLRDRICISPASRADGAHTERAEQEQVYPQ